MGETTGYEMKKMKNCKAKNNLRLLKMKNRLALVRVYYTSTGEPNFWYYASTDNIKTKKMLLQYSKRLHLALELPMLYEKDFQEYK